MSDPAKSAVDSHLAVSDADDVPADNALIKCANKVRTAMAELEVTAATGGLSHPGTLFRVLDRMTPTVESAAAAMAHLKERLSGAERLGLLVADHDDLDVTEAAREAGFALDAAQRLLLDAADQSSEAEQWTAGFRAACGPSPAPENLGLGQCFAAYCHCHRQAVRVG